ncbi:MAG TPA: hypothetical protein DCQ32_01285, partial [Cyanobacteria bacterium UBA8156]|nr:hypothetical protein [Cyanobacteria bacterium UBA8156]
RGPDFFVVRHTERRERLSWVVWEEGGRYPDLIVELLSTSTAAIDRGLKKELYQSRFRTPEYFWFSPDTLEFQGFRLVDATYQEIPPNPQGWCWSEVLELYLGVAGDRLRHFTAAGEMVPTPGEALAQERQQARREIRQVHRAQRQALQAKQRIEREKRQIQAQAERARQWAIQAQTQAEQERQRAIQAQTQAEQERQRAIQAQNQAEALRKRLEALGYNPD